MTLTLVQLFLNLFRCIWHNFEGLQFEARVGRYICQVPKYGTGGSCSGSEIVHPEGQVKPSGSCVLRYAGEVLRYGGQVTRYGS